LKQWDRFKHHPWGVLAIAPTFTTGYFEKRPSKNLASRVTLAHNNPAEKCKRINLVTATGQDSAPKSR